MKDNDFEEKLKVKTEPLNALLRVQIKDYLTGMRTLKDICKENRDNNNGLPISEKTMKKRILDLAEVDEEIRELLIKKESTIKRGYDYTIVILNMLINDLSQRVAADNYEVSRNTFKDAIERFKQGKPEIAPLIEKHAQVHSSGRNCEKVNWTHDEKTILEKFYQEYIKQQKPEKENNRGN